MLAGLTTPATACCDDPPGSVSVTFSVTYRSHPFPTLPPSIQYNTILLLQLGLDGKYARSKSEAEEREKAAKLKKTKRTLDKFKKRETAIIQPLSGLLGPVVVQQQSETGNDKSNEKQTVFITRDRLEAGKRVVSITDTQGVSPALSHIILTQDLSHLESKMPTNDKAKSFAGDSENDAPDPAQEDRSIFGVIKVFLANLHNCTVIVKCKIITGTIELHNCSNVVIKVEQEATVATVQADLSRDITIEFHDAVSGKHVPGQTPPLFWGDDADDRIFHAGLTNLRVAIYRDGFLETDLVADYQKDGAEQIGNATPEEFQFVTSFCDGALVTEKVVRAGNATGKNVRAMTDRELQAEQERREKAAKMAIKMAEDMVQIRDKDGNVLVKKTEPVADNTVETANENDNDNDDDDDDEVVEEIYTSCSADEIKSIVAECDQLKARGNEAFGAGEYGQAILHYSLCLDKAAELPDADSSCSNSNTNSTTAPLFPRDVIYSNRSAAFLKLGQHDKAEADANAALQINAENVKANFRKGLALHAAGRYAEALPVLAKAHKLEPQNKQIKQALQFAEVRLHQEQRKRMEQS